jgi:heterodisulfide reductase subunit A
VLEISYEDLSVNRFVRGAYDMVVLCNDVEPPPGLAALANAAGIELAESGYLAVNGNGTAIATSRPGVFVAGCASGPKNIRDSLTEAQAAASAATSALDPRVLQQAEAAEQAPQKQAAAGRTPPDDLRWQLEQLLNALVNR